MDGFILIDKPTGISSFGVVARVRGIIKRATGQKIKIGHSGTLDPAASGLMILVLGKYTKKAAEFSGLDKTYETELTLGSVSNTGDSEGDIVHRSDEQPAIAKIEEVLNTFVGEIEQTPPAYSAIKVNGQRSYKLARAGKTVALKSRKIHIYGIEDVEYSYPILSFTTSVSSGTYIRSLGEDIGAQLGVGAYTSSLRRTKVGKYNIEDALALDQLTFLGLEQHLATGVA